MSRELRTLKEVVSNLITVSDVFESVRGRFAKYNKEELLNAQEHIVAAIQSLQKGLHKVESGIRTEAQQLIDEEEAEELAKEEAEKIEETGE